MPKKRFSSQFSKPQSSVHPSLGSSAQALGSAGRDTSPSVNELITALRSSQISPSHRPPPTITTPTLPPQIRELLSHPETPAPAPRVRDRRHYDRNGRRVPGPPPPRSWLEESRHAPFEVRRRNTQRVYPIDVNHLPGLDHKPDVEDGMRHGGRRLQDMCLRRIARDWEFMQEYERNNLADLPTALRMQLLSTIAVYGPEDGVGFEGLKRILMVPEYNGDDSTAFDAGENNDAFSRLDLSGSIGWSISFKQLTGLVDKPVQLAEQDRESWEEGLTRSLRPPCPRLTHLSLSHPSPGVSWPRLVAFAKQVPTLTHLSLAYWPAPIAAPNSTTAVMTSSRGPQVQYGGTNYYSHSIDLDFREAAAILRRLANCLYSLEYLDLTACISWLPALYWKGEGETGIEWQSQWVRLSSLRVLSGYVLEPESEFWEVNQFVTAIKEQEKLDKALISARRSKDGRVGTWIEVHKDNWRKYGSFWSTSLDVEDRRKMNLLDTLKERS